MNESKLLDEALETGFLELKGLDPGSEEESKAIDNLAKLYRLKIEENKAISEEDDKLAQFTQRKKEHEHELELKALEREERKKDRLIKICVDGVTLILPMIFYATWMKKGFKFEETGTFTSTTFRGLFSKFKPNK